MKVTVFTDGAARANGTGPGGYGALLRYVDPAGRKHERQLSGGYRLTTNNRMELMGAIAALEALVRPCEVDLYSDSSYVIKAFTEDWIGTWKKQDFRRGRRGEVRNIDLWERLLAAAEPHTITFHWVKGHAGHPENELCDKLATSAADADEADLLVDDVYEKEVSERESEEKECDS